MKQNTLNALKESVTNSKKLKNHLIENCSCQEKQCFTLNLVSIDYHFEKSAIVIEYYVEDNDYPTIEINFELFIRLPAKFTFALTPAPLPCEWDRGFSPIIDGNRIISQFVYCIIKKKRQDY